MKQISLIHSLVFLSIVMLCFIASLSFTHAQGVDEEYYPEVYDNGDDAPANNDTNYYDDWSTGSDNTGGMSGNNDTNYYDDWSTGSDNTGGMSGNGGTGGSNSSGSVNSPTTGNTNVPSGGNFNSSAGNVNPGNCPIGKLCNPITATTLDQFILKIIDVLLIFAVPIIVLYIMYAGYLFVTAAGEAEQISHARTALLYAVIGGVIVLGAKLIITVIQGTVNAF